MKVICISGKAQHGKDAAAQFMKDILEDDGKSVLITHFGDLLKYICLKFFEWNEEKDDAGRSLLQYVGTDVIRKSQPDFWVNFIKSILSLFPTEWDYVIVSDCRFPNEYECIRDEGFDVTLVRVYRPDFTSLLNDEQLTHPSETAMDEYKFDYYIENNGSIEGLRKSTRAFLRLL
jgi:hypothetical protein